MRRIADKAELTPRVGRLKSKSAIINFDVWPLRARVRKRGIGGRSGISTIESGYQRCCRGAAVPRGETAE